MNFTYSEINIDLIIDNYCINQNHIHTTISSFLQVYYTSATMIVRSLQFITNFLQVLDVS